MRNRLVELWVGLFMIAGACALVYLATNVSGLTNISEKGFYHLTAEFDNVGGLKSRAPVRIAGVTIGRVDGIILDDKSYRARVSLLIDKDNNKLPKDTAAHILTEGILGSNYVSLSPGFEEATLASGDMIATTHPALILENMIGQLLFKMKEK
ncbi:MAG: outer membrane lipid asymmetry maintenance protein MlaD [Pseudomonadota bacterium]|nr:outer membrane lipid asymmetry maintenance protein MlaD [Pseudomonadota bacterium]